MKYYVLFVLICLTFGTSAQSIRKNYQEMTVAEKSALVNAFYELRTGPDLISDLANFHSDNFNNGNSPQPDIHFNLPDEPERQIFFAWHRMQMLELERAMQAIDPSISIPWWDSSTDQSTTSPLWSTEFMGQFNNSWALNRNLGGNGPLPTPAVVTTVQNTSDFLLYSNDMERGDTHRGAHVWTGGAMSTPLSPRDPVFYLHHTYIDKLWADWEHVHQGQSSFIITSMIRYDGTYVFDGTTLPLVDPDDLVSSHSLGVFYAENQLAQLYGYTVSNDHNPVENFYYQYAIEAGNGFTVPSGANCKIESVNEIRLLAGFEAAAGAFFVGRIDTNNDVVPPAFAMNQNNIRRPNPFEYNEAILDVNAFDPKESVVNSMIITYSPNPFSAVIEVQMDRRVRSSTMLLYNLSGKIVASKSFRNRSNLALDNLSELQLGVYVLEVIADGETVLKEKVIKN